MQPKTLENTYSTPPTSTDFRPLFDSLDHRCIRQLAHDLIQAAFGLDSSQWPRWATVAFINGLRLSHCEPALALALVAPAPYELRDEAEHLLKLLSPHTPFTINLNTLRFCFHRLASTPPPFLRGVLQDLCPPARLGHWFTAALVWGIHAGLSANELAAGRCLGFVDDLSLGHHFIANRLVILARCRRRSQRPTLIEMMAYSYAGGSLQRRVIPQAAEAVFRSLRHRGTPLHEPAWVMSGFRDGLLVSFRDPAVACGLLQELPAGAWHFISTLFDKEIGRSPKGWTRERLVGCAIKYTDTNHSYCVGSKNRIETFECIRHLFDFAFWMGVAAGSPSIKTS